MIDGLIKAFELCKTAIEVLHPILNPDEPCIAYEAHEEASNQIRKLKNLTNKLSRPTNKLSPSKKAIKKAKARGEMPPRRLPDPLGWGESKVRL